LKEVFVCAKLVEIAAMVFMCHALGILLRKGTTFRSAALRMAALRG